MLTLSTSSQRVPDFALHKASGAHKSRDFQRQITPPLGHASMPERAAEHGKIHRAALRFREFSPDLRYLPLK